jgi:small subunit ribosomal protein S1
MSEADSSANPPVPPAPQAEQKQEPAPTAAPAPPAPAPPQGAPKPEPRPERPRLGPRIPGRHPDRGERREPQPARPPSLEPEQHYGGRVSVKEFDAQVERELEEAMSGLSAKEIYGEPTEQQRRKPAGDTKPGLLKGKVVSVHNADVFVDVPGGRSQGVLPLMQFPDGPPESGTEVEVTIEGYDGANGLLLLSRKGQAQEVDWSSVARGMIVEVFVSGTNKGGLSIEVNRIRGFLPISQIDLYRVENAETYVGQRLRCEVMEVNPSEKNLIVSRRVLLEREREENREKLWNELAEGQVREGVVRNIKEFGAFVDLGGADGLLHIGEMSWARIKDPTEVVQLGQTVKVVVLKIDREKRKLSLGLRQLQASPWDNIGDKYPHGSRVKGKVTRVQDFGAFVELEPAVEGLIHISELSPARVRRVIDIVKVGQDVEVVVVSLDPAQRRIGLSLKAALPKAEEPEAAPEEEPEEEAPPPKPRIRTTPLRGGTGGGGPLFSLPPKEGQE